MTQSTPRPATHARLSIGALSRATGVPVETIRTWEARYGFPVPERKPSGHRVYRAALIPRLRRVAEALTRGLRAGQVVPASEAELGTLLEITNQARQDERTTSVPPAVPPPLDMADAMQAVLAYDADRLTRLLLTQSMRRGVVEFVDTEVAPLIREVGEAWSRGRLDISHEHFLSARVSDVLSSLRLPHEDRAEGPLVVFSTLPGELHTLGLQMAALVAAAAGCRILYLGAETPIEQVAALARDLGARAVAVSISRATRGEQSTRRLARLRMLLPRSLRLAAGGEGAPRGRRGVEAMGTLHEMDEWARHLSSRSDHQSRYAS